MSQSNDAPERRTRYGSNGAVDLELIASELAQVEAKMEQLLVSREPLLSEIAAFDRGGGSAASHRIVGIQGVRRSRRDRHDRRDRPGHQFRDAAA